MQILLSVVAGPAGTRSSRDLVVSAEADSTVADLAAALDRVASAGATRDRGAEEAQPLHLVVGGEPPSAVPPPDLWDGATRLDAGQALGGGAVHDGMVLGLGSPVPDGEEPGGVVELRVVAGAGAGTVRRLGLGRYTVGGDGADIVLEDCDPGGLVDLVVGVGGEARLTPCDGVADRPAPAAAPRRHPLPGPVVLDPPEDDAAPQGRRRRRRTRGRRHGRDADRPAAPRPEERDADAPRLLLELDRRQLRPGTVWVPGAVLTVAGSLLTVGPVPEADAVAVPTPGAPTIDFNRPPRLARPTRERVFVLPRRPQPPRRPPFPLAVLVSPIVMGGGSYLVTHRVASLLFVLLSPIMMLANRIQGRSARRRDYRDGLRRYEEQRTSTENAALAALVEERRLRRLDSPDPAEALLRATGPRSGLWERRPVDPDWLELRVGTADVPSEVELKDPERALHEEPLRWTAPDVPVTVGLGRLGVVGVAGTRRDRVVSWMVAQAAALHSPAELELVLLVDPGQGRDAHRRWDWARWLPHLRNPEGAGARARVGTDDETVARRVNELVAMIDARARRSSPGQTGPLRRVLVVLDGARALRLVPGVVHLLREGPRYGIDLVCVDVNRSALPEECRAVVGTGPGPASVSEAERDEVEQVRLDLVPPGWCERIARALAPVHDVSTVGAEGAVPTSSRLLDVIGMPEPDARAVLSAWERAGGTTRAVIGEDAEGLFSVDVRADGPHALVAGTTGSGKSELLQTLIASLCVNNSPDDMTFVLVDYKGGAAFKDCARLPHTVGMVTDLDGHLTARALESLGAELRRREHQLARADAKDIEDYRAAMQPGDDPMPRLIIIIDEFAALVSELPGFVTGLVDIARRGRSLGVHLVLATQRPAGVVSAEIKSNTNLRIALRVTDEGDSQDVIESGDSARIPPSVPGRAYARLGHASLRQFQASRVGGRPRGTGPRADLRTSALTLAGLSRPEPTPPARQEDPTVPTDLANVVDAMTQAHRETGRPDPHSPWLEPLPEVVTLDGLAAADPVAGEPPVGFLPPLVLGLEDLPSEQSQRVMTWDYTRAGHLGVAGAPRSGRSSVLRAVAVAVARTVSPADAHLYGVDAGSGALLPLVSLPHTGAVVTRDQPDRVRRLVSLLGREVSQRQQELALHGFASLAEQRAATDPEKRLPYLVLLIDRWDGFVASFEQVDGGALLDGVETLLREGAAVGLRVVITGDRATFRGRLGMMLEDRLVLRMPSAEDFELVGMRARDVPASMPPGRAFRTGAPAREVQLAVLDDDTTGTAQVAALHREGQEAVARWGEPPVRSRPARVDELPLVVSAAQALALGPTLRPGELALAVGGDTLALQPLRMEEVGNGILVLGPRQSGRSTALGFGVETALSAGAAVVVVTPRRSPLAAYRDRTGVLGLLDAAARADDLRALLAGHGADTLVVVDDFDVLGNDHALGPVLEDHVRACRDATGGVLVACGVDELAGMYRGLMAQVKKTRTGLLLAPRSAQDGDAFSARLPRSVGAPVPKGRAVLATPGTWAWVQVPLTEPDRNGQ